MKTFICKRCGACCQGESTVSLSQEEVTRIARYLGLEEETFKAAFLVKKGEKRLEMKIKEGFCIFYDREKGLCQIHPVKPERCKEWPFPPVIFKDKENFEIIRAFCEGLKDFNFEDINKLKT